MKKNNFETRKKIEKSNYLDFPFGILVEVLRRAFDVLLIRSGQLRGENCSSRSLGALFVRGFLGFRHFRHVIKFKISKKKNLRFAEENVFGKCLYFLSYKLPQ